MFIFSIIFLVSVLYISDLIFIIYFLILINLNSILKSRDITLPTKVRSVKAMVFQWSCMDVRVGL